MTGMLYRWPAAAAVGSRIPKEKFYEHGTVNGSVREKFVCEVQRIIWAYKLAEATINLRGDDKVPEIQVFQIDCKGDDVSDAVLTAIDKAIPLPIIFEITRSCAAGAGGETRMVAAYKELGRGAPKLGPYFITDWQPPSADRFNLPTAINLTGLYTALLDPLTPIASRAGETVSDVVDRLTAVRSLEREIATLERKLRNEPQLNRKVELRRIIKTKQAMLVDLTSPTSGHRLGSTK